ncbi:extensin family protein [Donghicola sp. C2-DW-16]|uniref:Extensin family protein n=1 Tax=Donghicola mangrovi TaxID=2729614 RepID=A0ABX2PGI2_9RHOB|nr:extensin family protein [Donghicola mangrovi]NVO28216.1 extensin family protein [Donghicola mangrovi]
MMRGLVIALMMGATAASAFNLETSLRPVARPETAGAELVATEALASSLRPKARPNDDHAAMVLAAIQASPPKKLTDEERAAALAAATNPEPAKAEEPKAVVTVEDKAEPEAEPVLVASAGAFILPNALRPQPRPKGITQKAILRREQQIRGSVCGDPEIQGTDAGVILASTAGCGVEDAVKVKSIAGIPLSQVATIDCATAKALKKWVVNGLVPAVGSTGGGLSKIDIMGSYTCRPRNNQAGQKISEHGKGRAVDIGGITLRDGTKISVLKDWTKQKQGKILKAAYSKACGTFGTTLGPNANRFHQDHFHFDTARYRNGAYCK